MTPKNIPRSKNKVVRESQGTYLFLQKARESQGTFFQILGGNPDSYIARNKNINCIWYDCRTPNYLLWEFVQRIEENTDVTPSIQLDGREWLFKGIYHWMYDVSINKEWFIIYPTAGGGIYPPDHILYPQIQLFFFM